MNAADPIREFILELLARGAREKGLAPVDPRDELHMVDSGLVDSFAFLVLLADVEERFGIALDLSGADPSEFLTVGGLARLAAQAAAAKRPSP